MDFITTYRLLFESPYTKAMTYFRVWCDDNDEYVKSKDALFKYGIQNKIPKQVIHEIADDMRIDVDSWDDYKWK